MEMSGVFTFALSPQCRGNTRDFCYIGMTVRIHIYKQIKPTLVGEHAFPLTGFVWESVNVT